MEDLNYRVLQGFGVRAKKVVKEKSYYICSTDKGQKVIRKSLDTCRHIEFQHEIKEQICKKGFSLTDRYNLTLSGQPYLELDNCIFVMTDYQAGNEINIGEREELIKAIKILAKFHTVARDLNFRGDYFYCNDRTTEEFKKGLHDLKGIKKSLANQRRLSDFDVLFLKNYNSFVEYIQKSLRLLENTAFEFYKQKALEKNTICHNRIKEENFIISDSGMHLVGFSSSAIDLQLFDICALIQRQAKFLPKQTIPPKQILEVYSKVKTLTKEHLHIIHALLIYPNRFIKLCKQYYLKKRNFIPSALINRMECLLNNATLYDNYVNTLIE